MKSIMVTAMGAIISRVMYVRVGLSMTWPKRSTFRNMTAYMMTKEVAIIRANFAYCPAWLASWWLVWSCIIISIATERGCRVSTNS